MPITLYIFYIHIIIHHTWVELSFCYCDKQVSWVLNLSWLRSTSVYSEKRCIDLEIHFSICYVTSKVKIKYFGEELFLIFLNGLMRLMVQHTTPLLWSEDSMHLLLICGTGEKKKKNWMSVLGMGLCKLPTVHILHSLDTLIGIIRLQRSWKEEAINRN